MPNYDIKCPRANCSKIINIKDHKTHSRDDHNSAIIKVFAQVRFPRKSLLSNLKKLSPDENEALGYSRDQPVISILPQPCPDSLGWAMTLPKNPIFILRFF